MSTGCWHNDMARASTLPYLAMRSPYTPALPWTSQMGTATMFKPLGTAKAPAGQIRRGPRHYRLSTKDMATWAVHVWRVVVPMEGSSIKYTRRHSFGFVTWAGTYGNWAGKQNSVSVRRRCAQRPCVCNCWFTRRAAYAGRHQVHNSSPIWQTQTSKQQTATVECVGVQPHVGELSWRCSGTVPPTAHPCPLAVPGWHPVWT